jgi:8-oxo-dGTP diphosphatase
MQYVVGFAFTEDERAVLLISKTHPDWQKGFFNGPGGKVEENEIPEQCMRREYIEETGIDIADWTLFHRMEGKGFTVYFYKAFNNIILHAKQFTDEKLVFFIVNRLPDNIISNLAWLIPQALDKTKYHFPHVSYMEDYEEL